MLASMPVHAGAAVGAAFLGSFVEFVEALTIVLAVGTVRGWRPALAGTLAGAIFLAVLVAALGPALRLISIQALQLLVGSLLLLFGMRWLRKAILRAAGVIALHDEAAIYRDETRELGGAQVLRVAGWDAVAVATTFKAVVLEGLEVVFIVIAVGAVGDLLMPASAGAAAALVCVVVLGLALHRPLARIPENALKFAVGVLLSAFGVFWLGEGLGYPWPGGEWSLLGLLGALMATSIIATTLSRQARTAAAAASED
jgi:uncharacterized membrane protein